MLCASLLFALAPLPSCDVHVDERHGFRIDVPAGWRKQEQQGGEGFVLALLPSGSAGEVALSVTVRDLPGDARGDAGMQQVLAAARGRIDAGGESFSEVEECEDTIAGRAAPGFRVRYHAQGADYRIVATYVLEGGRAYAFQRIAPLGEFEERAAEFRNILASFAFVELSEEGRAERERQALVERCGSEVDWAPDWKSAAARAREQRRPVLVVAYLYAGFAMTDTPRTGLFMDEDVIELVNERCVPLSYTKGMPAAFVRRYGMSGTTFGQALMLVSPDGDVLLESQEAGNAAVAHAFLSEALARHPELPGTPPAADLPALERARRHVARGELGVALEALEGDASGPAEALRARVLRLERRGEDALAALARARAAGGVPEVELMAEEASLLMRLGRDAASRTVLERIERDHPGADEALEARLGLGLLDVRAGERGAARERWEALAREHPESRWAWLAAVALESSLLDTDLRPDCGWPSAAVVAEHLAFNEPSPLPLEDAARAAAGGLAWLLEEQRADGSWLSPMEVSRNEQMGPSPFTDSITALAMRALLRNLEVEGSRAAAGRALAYLVASIEERKQTPPRVFYMDYMTWSDAVMLHALADALEVGLAEREALEPAIEALLADLASRQVAGDGWSYYVTGDLEGAAAPPQSISFTTATGVLGLARVRELGFEVPDGMLDAAVSALERMRDERGVFAYFLFHGTGQPLAATAAAGAVGRGPACELALLRAGKSTPERLRGALDLFLEHAPLFSAEQGKVLMHAGPDGQGCHYLFYDYAHAALAQEALPMDAQTRARVLEMVLDCRQPDGAFLDTPILGRAYGTAMALIAFDALSQTGE